MDDLVIRDARIIDGTGRPGFAGDIAAKDGVLTQVGGTAGRGKREINADGCIVTPGFVDIHTHYDAQVHWDPYLSCSSWNGVTSVVMGNCGVGFAPAKPAQRESLIALMTLIEQIPSESLRAGLTWDWETFPEFMDALDRRKLVIDVGAQVPHGPVRGYVMGERGMENEPATEDELRAMEDVVREAMSVGALGLTGSRTPMFRSPAGKDAPGYGLALDEMIRLGRAAGEAGHGGVIGINTFFENLDEEFMWLRRMRTASGLSTWFLFTQQHFQPEKYPILVKKIEQSVREGEPIFGQHAGRPVNHLLGLMSSRNPFLNRPSYQAIKDLSLPERVARLKDPAFRERLLSEKTESQSREGARANAFHLMFRLGDPPDYEPPPEKSIAAIAKAAGKAPEEVALDMMLERDGHELILSPVTNYLTGDASVVWDMLHNPNAFVGLGDGGAHSMTICDESIPTFMLTHWARDRKRGPKLSLEQAVRKVTSQGAEFFGLRDRGVLAVGKKADINVIDFDALTLHAPEVAADQPAGGSRLVQGADGYVATIVAGTPIFENGKATGAMPGKLIRSTARSG